MSAPSDQPPGPRVSETRARGGFRDTPVLWVLVGSLALAVVLVFGAMLWNPGKQRSMNADAGLDQREAVGADTQLQPPKGD